MANQTAIEIKASLNEKDLEDFYAHLAKKSIGMKMMVVFSMLIFVAQSIRIIVDPSALESGIIWIVLVIFLFAMMLYSNKYNTRRAFKNNRRLQAEYTYLISDSNIQVKSDKHTTTLQWSDIHKITESKNSLFLWLNKKQAQIIPKRDLSGDELEAIYILKKLNLKK